MKTTILAFICAIFMAVPAIACPTEIDLSAISSVAASGGTLNKVGFVTAGALDASSATASQVGNTVKTSTVTGGSAFSSSPKIAAGAFAAGAFAGGATATIDTKKLSVSVGR
jgi:hypothetical protein